MAVSNLAISNLAIRNREISEIVDGLSADQKQISPKYFYDERGSQLFDDITQLPEYYLTKTELGIMRDNIAEITASVGKQASLIEFGSGSSLKTRIRHSRFGINSRMWMYYPSSLILPGLSHYQNRW